MNTLEEQLETWRPVVGYEGRYEVSDEGRVRSLNYRGRKGLVAIMNPAINAAGYFLTAFGKRHMNKMIHVAVAEAFLGKRPDGFHINHKNGIKTDNRLSNLEYCTPSENSSHAHRTGLQKVNKGEQCSYAKLTEKNISEIRLLRSSGLKQREIASRFNISRQHVGDILLNKKWAHLT